MSIAAFAPAGRSGRRLHPLAVRIMHWTNAVAMLIMITSGWGIYNDDVIIRGLHFSQYLRLGDWAAWSLNWHFAGMWLLTINGIIYFAYGIFSGHFRRTLFPVGPAAILRDAIAALQFRLPHRLGAYNAVQKTLYLGVLAVGVIMVLSGLAIWKPAQFQELTWLFGGFDAARVIHFLGMTAIVLFLMVHIALVIIVPRTLPTMITGRASADEVHDES